MFYCTPCRDKNKWPGIIPSSRGTCEVCGKIADCFDIPSKDLPIPKNTEPPFTPPTPADIQAEIIALAPFAYEHGAIGQITVLVKNLSPEQIEKELPNQAFAKHAREWLDGYADNLPSSFWRGTTNPLNYIQDIEGHDERHIATALYLLQKAIVLRETPHGGWPTIHAALRDAGQHCEAARRYWTQEAVVERHKMADAVEKLISGHSDEKPPEKESAGPKDSPAQG